MSKRLPWIWPDRRQTPEETKPTASARPDRRSGRERRRSRIRLRLEIAVPVVLRGENGAQRGLARNISEGGMLVEVAEAPPIGSRVSVTLSGIDGATDSPDAVTLAGEVRHHVAWQYNQAEDTQVMRGVGIRFVEQEVRADEDPVGYGPWFAHAAGQTVH